MAKTNKVKQAVKKKNVKNSIKRRKILDHTLEVLRILKEDRLKNKILGE